MRVRNNLDSSQHTVVPPDKMYEGLVDGEDWYLVETDVC